VLGSLAVERIFDLGMLGLFWALSLPFTEAPPWFRWSGYLTVGIGLGVGILLWLLHASRDRARAWSRHPLFARLPARLGRAASSAIPAFGAGLSAVGRPALVGRSAVWSVAIWLTSGAVFLLVGESLGITLPLWSVFLLTFVVCVGISVPSSPGFLGVMEGACVLGLSLLGVSGPEALAFAILYHVTQLVPPLILGSYYVVKQHLTLEMVGHAPAEGGAGGRKKRRQ
jgi:uncharacterized membrane protein YbhN (UPF0104 family)